MNQNKKGSKQSQVYEAGENVSDWSACFADLKESWGAKHLWMHTAWRDIYLRYLNSLLGPLWITISMAVFIGCFSIIGASLFSMNVGDYLPFLTVSLVVWTFVSATIVEGSDIFVAHAYLILDQRTPYLASILRLLLRGLLILGHNALIFVLVSLVFPTPISFDVVFSVLGLILLCLFLAGISLMVSVMSAKYRDIPQLITSGLQVFLFLTPIMWDPGLMIKAGRVYVLDYNPFYHFLELIRNPLLGREFSDANLIVSMVATFISLSLGLIVFARYRRRIAYWL